MEDAQKNSAGTNTDNKLRTPIKQGKNNKGTGYSGFWAKKMERVNGFEPSTVTLAT